MAEIQLCVELVKTGLPRRSKTNRSRYDVLKAEFGRPLSIEHAAEQARRRTSRSVRHHLRIRDWAKAESGCAKDLF